MTILITGASGHLGRLVVDRLIARGAAPSDIVAGARTPAKAADLAEKGVKVVHLDYSDASSIPAALGGVDRALLVSGTDIGHRVEQHRAVIDAASAAGLELLAYTSCGEADTTDFMLAPEHKATEEILTAADVPSVVLRNVWYIENYLDSARQAASTGVLVGAAGEGRVAAATREDYADAAAVVLLACDGQGRPVHAGRTYELAGDDILTYPQIAAAIGEAVDRKVFYRDLSAEEYAATLKNAGLDEATAGMLAAMDAGIADGGLDIDSHDLSRLIGRPTTSFAEGIRAALAQG